MVVKIFFTKGGKKLNTALTRRRLQNQNTPKKHGEYEETREIAGGSD